MESLSAETAILRREASEDAMSLLRGTMGPSALDLRDLSRKTELLTFDPGFGSTASCESRITYIDGKKGLLLHRGYPIEQLAVNADFMETAYLLLNGELPTQAQYEAFRTDLGAHYAPDEQIRRFIAGFRRDTHPMAILSATVSALSAFYGHDAQDSAQTPPDQFARQLIAQMPTIAAWAYKHTAGDPLIAPERDLSPSENLLHMLFSQPGRRYEIDPVLARALDRILILHADHEQSASTTAVRLVGSTGANPFACVSAGIAALWGPAHGGANEAVVTMLQTIGRKENIPSFLETVKDRSSRTRLMGFGHRVYKNFDPRAKIMRDTCHEVINTLGLERDPMLDLARELERIAMEDDYFVSRKLYPNVDFYSGLILKAIGVEMSMFTALFAVARTAGWTSQWLEMVKDPATRIYRPRQLYVGAAERPFVPMDRRS